MIFVQLEKFSNCTFLNYNISYSAFQACPFQRIYISNYYVYPTIKVRINIKISGHSLVNLYSLIELSMTLRSKISRAFSITNGYGSKSFVTVSLIIFGAGTSLAVLFFLSGASVYQRQWLYFFHQLLRRLANNFFT